MERPTLHTRHKSGFSLKSDKSRSSKQSHKETLKETPEEKRKSHFTSSAKSNPNAAMTEAQPVAQQLEESTIGSLRSVKHLDSSGQIIDEPDLSNPTRSRWESPLATIRSFEAAIDNGYRRRASMMMRNDSEPDGMASGFASRRSSYYGGQRYPDQGFGPRRMSQVGGFYGDRQSYYDGNANNGGPQQGYGQRNRYSQRDPSYNRQAPGQIYPTQQYHQSRDTVNTGGSSNQSEPWAHSTNPSSENSSIERHTPGEWNYSGTGGPVQPNGRIPEERHNYRGANQPHSQNNGYFPQQHYDVPPPPPKHGQPRAPNKVIRLSSADQFAQGQHPPQPPPKGGASAPTPKADKRKSWFKRTFSKD